MDAHPPTTVIFLGRDDFGFARLVHSGRNHAWRAEGLFEHADLQSGAGFPFTQLLERAERALDPVSARLAGITGYWDFPVTSMVPILCERYGLPGPKLESVLKCEHKYWARMCQEAVVPEATPAFRAVDPFREDLIAAWDFGYPFWLKPVKSWSSQLGFKVESRKEFAAALARIRAGIGRFAEPFNDVLRRATLPDAIADVDGYHCIAERLIGGRQCTLEGFVSQGKARTYALFDSIRYGSSSSFARYEYPSQLPRIAKLEMVEIAERLMEAIGYDQATFNIEFFWDVEGERPWLLEVNPRLSASHADISLKVDGVSNLERMAELAAGLTPRLHKEAGEYRVAAKFMLRRFEDALVTRVPAPDEVAAIEHDLDGVAIQLTAIEGQRLSDLINQDSYSFELALIHIGGRDDADLHTKYQACLDRLHFEFENLPEATQR